MIVDIGAADKPYYQIFKRYIKNYIGVDIDTTENPEVVASADNLPFDAQSFDVALCFQVLEHIENPQKVLAEIKRILKPQGYLILTTHGIWNYHPFPKDLWRFTQEGLTNLFSKFSDVEVKPNLKSTPSILQLINIELYRISCQNFILKIPFYALITTLNLIGSFLINSGDDSLAVNYIALAKT